MELRAYRSKRQNLQEKDSATICIRNDRLPQITSEQNGKTVDTLFCDLSVRFEVERLSSCNHANF